MAGMKPDIERVMRGSDCRNKSPAVLARDIPLYLMLTIPD